MPRRMSSSQIRSKLRQAQSRQRQALNRFDSAVRSYNNQVRQHNSERRRAIDNYNREVRSYNARVRANQSRLRMALQSLSTRTIGVRYSASRESLVALHAAYERLDNGNADPFILDLAERDTANSATLLNTLLGDESQVEIEDRILTRTKLAELLGRYSPEMRDRWSGAIFALSPLNPDAARHFCSSSRELLADILNSEAPDADVLARFPDCQVTEQGTPTRRSKIHYCLDRSGMKLEALEEFIEVNIKDLSVLFKDLNTGAHGPAGRFSISQLTAIKTRVEDAVEFVCEIVA